MSMEKFLQRGLPVAVIAGAIAVLLGGCEIPFFPTPQKIMQGMYTKLATLISVKYDLDAEVKGWVPNMADIVASGFTGEAPKANAKGDFKIQSKGKTETFYYAIQPDMVASSEIDMNVDQTVGKVKVDSVALDDKYYLKFNELSSTLGLTNTESLIGTWYSFPRAAVEEMYMPEDVTVDDGSSSQELTDEETQQIEDLLKTTKFFVVAEEDGFKREVIDGEKVWHIQGHLDAEATLNFYIEYYKIIGYPLDDEKTADLKATIDNLAALDVDLYVLRSNYELYKFEAVGDYKSASNGQVYRLNIALTLTDYNTPVKAVVPEGSKPFTYNDLIKVLGTNSSVQSMQKSAQEVLGSEEAQQTANEVEQGLTELEEAAAAAGAETLEQGINKLKKGLGL